MEKTKNLNLALPSQDDFFNVQDFNNNFKAIDSMAETIQAVDTG